MKIRTELYSQFKSELTDSIMDRLKLYVSLLKLQGYINAYHTFTFSDNKQGEKIIKFHLCRDIGKKLITIYYNICTKQMYY